MEHIDALEAVRRLTLERDALAEQVRRLERRNDPPPVWDVIQDGFWVHHGKGFVAYVSRRDGKFHAEAKAGETGKCHIAPFDRFYQAANHALDLGAQLAGNALQAPERRDNHKTGTEAGEGANGASRGCNAPSWGKIARDVIWCASLALQNEIRLADTRKDWDELRRLQKGKMALDRIRDELSNIDRPALVV